MIGSDTINTVSNMSASHGQSHFSVISVFSSADLMGKTVLLTLLICSIWSWSIILYKLFQIRSVKKNIAQFESSFWSGQALDQLYENIKRRVDGPMSAVFISAMNEFKDMPQSFANDAFSIKIGHKDRIIQAMNLAKNRAVDELSNNMNILALIGSNAIFIGILGTVLGIIPIFQSMALAKNNTLMSIAPGIAEALFSNALGIITSIPASVFYNHLSTQIDKVHDKIDDFINELSNILFRAIDLDKK